MSPSFFSPFPVLKTQRLILRKLELDDEPNVFLIRSDPEMGKYLDRPLYKTTDEARRFIVNILEGIDENRWLYWAITFRNQSELIGTVCLWKFTPDFGTAEIGFELMPGHQKKGIMQEAVEAVISFAFTDAGLKTLEAEVDPANQASVKLLTRNKFSLSESQTSPEIKTVIYKLHSG